MPSRSELKCTFAAELRERVTTAIENLVSCFHASSYDHSVQGGAVCVLIGVSGSW